METLRLTEQELDLAARLLKEGHPVAFPTETVYGLGAPIFSPDAIASIFTLKGRPQDNPLIAHVSDLSQVELIAQEIPDIFYRIAEIFFPGPLTVVLLKKPCVPPIVSAGLPTIALRMPAHRVARALIEKVGEPLVAPSANLSGKPSPTCCEHVLEDFSGKIKAVLDGGKTEYGIESTVIGLLEETPVLMRLGAISLEELQGKLGCAVKPAQDTSCSPGMKYRHYAPRTPIRLFQDLDALQEHLKGRRCLILSSENLPGSLPLCAKEFYAHLRYADAERYDEILILCDEKVLSDLALMNRICHATEKG